MAHDIGDPGFPPTHMDTAPKQKETGVLSTRDCGKDPSHGKMRFNNGIYSCHCGFEDVAASFNPKGYAT